MGLIYTIYIYPQIWSFGNLGGVYSSFGVMNVGHEWGFFYGCDYCTIPNEANLGDSIDLSIINIRLRSACNPM